eukprot:TRINITY_DN7527_c0_g1_i2.p1 TRINITY_DN7527_c0_g1~~TRINITY_DN7527_c0_g1_i2.p1  ORF type:complete len:657 (-),score=107.15 TRINITY_DN7527_c0_g1_i2:313-2283(-)
MNLRKDRVLLARLICSTFILCPLVISFGVLEVQELLKNKGVYRSVEDHNCFVYLYPYGADDTALTFEVYPVKTNGSLLQEMHEEDWQVVQGVSFKSIVEIDIAKPDGLQARHSIAKPVRLQSRECKHRFMPEPGNVGQYRIHLSDEGDATNETALELSSCHPSTSLVEPFEYADDEASALAAASLLVYSWLRVLGPLRDYLKRNFDAGHPPLPVRPKKLATCFPLSLISRRGIVWRNVYQVALRPFILYGMVTAQLLRPWTSLTLHDDCPQLIMQNGNPQVILVGVIAGLLIAVYSTASLVISNKPSRVCMQECKGCADDLGHCITGHFGCWFPCFCCCCSPCCFACLICGDVNPYDLNIMESGKEHGRGSEVLLNILVFIAVTYLITAFILTWPLTLLVEVRFIFTWKWPSYVASRWAHALEILSIASLAFDALTFLLKLTASTDDIHKEAVQSGTSMGLQYAAEDLRADREFVLAAVKQHGHSLEFAAEALKSDKEIVLAAVAQHGHSLEFAAEALKSDREFVLEAVKQHAYVLEYSAEALGEGRDRKFWREVVKQKGCALEYAAEALKSDREFVLEAVKQHGLALKCAAEALKSDKEIVLEAVKQEGLALQHAAEALKSDREFVLEAVKQNRSALRYAAEALKADEEVLAACR